MMINKISGLYGLLALLTGYHLSPVQLSMYLYSLVVLAVAVYLFPHIRKQSPLQCLALAWIYLIDSVVNAAYTVAFGVTWFMVISQNYDSSNGKSSSSSSSSPGKATMEQTAGFTSAKYDSSKKSDAIGNVVYQPESFQSIIFICSLWIIRTYFVLVMLAFARQSLRMYVAVPRHTQLPTHSRNTSLASVADIDREPFSTFSPDGQGWEGKLGRLMIGIGRGYWLGEDDSSGNPNWATMVRRPWARPEDLSGPLERERRRRSGTGPPQPSQFVIQAASLQQQPIPEEAPLANVKMQPWPENR
ncbi:hypothetical protein ASPZODRAFT_127149 [Penicilliopsis zonata CBS 506.65]|uniref:DUF1753 domain-containing protein n=1 Tax=Penicilliopsis zonata CBS 506.65 TaxID=1073090 RepID=A0A1L9SVJ8_9EURO|nr:hypothetical protein ASPZODRAFT_127149 [Penicilliopsis zonata CBS 506.65]OJJ51131.1 hypothetical protein ASPZODRAFT_127149 [Penicilliopsis zonata CBS 506.65]